MHAANADRPSAGIDARTLDRLEDELRSAGVRLVVGTATNPAGLVLAKSVPVGRLAAFVRSGCGMSPAHNAYGLGGGMVEAPSVRPVGDFRLRLDPSGVRVFGEGVAIGPTDTYFLDGTPDQACPRLVLARVVRDLATEGLHALVGHELEFVLVRPDGSLLQPGNWTPYGAGELLAHEEFVLDLLTGFERAEIGLEQVHAEYGESQFEVSLEADDPIRAADALVVARLLVARAAVRHGLAASFSPLPTVGEVGNGAHQHLSLHRGETELFASGSGPYGLTDEGAHAIAGLVAGLPQAQAVLAGSALSGARLRPGERSGAYACWGVENREAAVRFVTGGPAAPGVANVEVKIVDASADPYLAEATLLGLALDGIRRRLPLPQEVTTDPGALSEDERERNGVERLAPDQGAMIDHLAASDLMERILGPQVVSGVVAACRHQHDRYAETPLDVLVTRLRLAWS